MQYYKGSILNAVSKRYCDQLKYFTPASNRRMF